MMDYFVLKFEDDCGPKGNSRTVMRVSSGGSSVSLLGCRVPKEVLRAAMAGETFDLDLWRNRRNIFSFQTREIEAAIRLLAVMLQNVTKEASITEGLCSATSTEST